MSDPAPPHPRSSKTPVAATAVPAAVSNAVAGSPDLTALVRGEQPFLWGLALRITGSAADADDVVQEAFARFLSHPPADQGAPLRPWLLRVVSRLAIDVLRRRRRTPYVGPWLPSPVPDPDAEPIGDEPTPTARYDVRESLTFGFLLALEALTPQQRAVLVLRDVLDLDVRETATALEMSDSNVKVVHLRGRRKLASYDRARIDTSRAAQARVQTALNQLLFAIVQQDVAAVARLLSPQVILLNDGGGQYLAARKPVRGVQSVSSFLVKVPRLGGAHGQFSGSLAQLAGQPCVVVTLLAPPATPAPPESSRVAAPGSTKRPRPRIAPLSVLALDVDADGRITAIYNVLADRKLSALPAT